MGNYFGRVIIILALFTAGFILLAVGLSYTENNKNHVLILGAGSQGGESYEFALSLIHISEPTRPY